ncbi:MAG: hypothetical protein ACRDNS_22040, partial [Trebonia sp.]
MTALKSRRSTIRYLLILAILGAAGLVAAAVYELLSGAGPRPGPPTATSRLIAEDAGVTGRLLTALQFRDGEWMPSRYSTPDWEKYQTAALASAALGARPAGSPSRRNAAIMTVNAAITHHQLPNGDFDAGTAAAGTSSVSGGFWVEDEGMIALTLHRYVPKATLRAWERSVTRYVQFLVRSHSAQWYSNGNVVLRQTVIMLEAYRLARLVGDPAAVDYWHDYVSEKRFLVRPTAVTGTHGAGEWRTYG